MLVLLLVSRKQLEKMTTNKSIQTKPARQRTKTAGTTSIYFWILAFVAVTAPFWHYPFIKSDIEGVCGYPYMSSFLYAIGNVLSLFSLAMILLIVSPKTSEYKRSVKLLGSAMLYVSLYFLLMVVIDKEWALDTFGVKDMPIWGYRLSLVFLAGVSGVVFIRFNKAALKTEKLLTTKIRLLVEHIIDNKERYLPLVKKAAVLEQQSPPIDGKSWQDQVNAIEVMDYKVLKEVSG